jgi:hypothetical protein
VLRRDESNVPELNQIFGIPVPQKFASKNGVKSFG